MSNVINLNLGVKSIPFNFGEFNLEYFANDKKDDELEVKAKDLQKRASELDDNDSDMENKEIRQKIKSLIDEVFETMFDKDAPQKIYEAVGENTMNYLGVFFQISETIQKERIERQNDDIFTKYLAKK